jgi:hypothetical protein
MRVLCRGPRYLVRLSVPRRSGWRAWLPVSGDFERRLAEQESPVVIAQRVDAETRRGADYVRVTVIATIAAADVAEALTAALAAEFGCGTRLAELEAADP